MRKEITPDSTLIKVVTKDNRYYTYMVIPWDSLEEEFKVNQCSDFPTLREYAYWLASEKIKDIVYEENKDFLWLYPEDRALSKDNIKEIYVDECMNIEGPIN